jgi:hypothetical protein
MDFIRPWLAIGKYRETRDEAWLRVYGIGAVLQLAEAVPYTTIAALYLPVEDGEPLPTNLLRAGLDFILAEKLAGHVILVACGAGISRAVTFAVAALKQVEQLGLLDALREVKRYHPEAMPHPELWASLALYYREDVSLDDMLQVVT